MIELMVVIFVIGLATSAVLLSGQGGGRHAARVAETLAVNMAALRDHSVIEARPSAIWISRSGYGFEQLTAAGIWQPVSGKAFRSRDWPRDIMVRAEAKLPLRVEFDQIGLPDQARTIQIKEADLDPVLVRLSPAGEVVIEN